MFEDAKWITAPLEEYPDRSILLRKCFSVDFKVKKAVLSIAQLGLGVCEINQKPVTEDIFTTPFTRYDKTVFYNEYDVTPLIREGGNCIGVHLGNGFYNNSCDGWGYSSALWRDVPKMLAELKLESEGGKSAKISTDSTWRTHCGAVLYNQMREGEIYDAREEKKAFSRVDFDSNEWYNAHVVRGPGGKLKKNYIEPERITGVSAPKYLGGGIYDFGGNISGFCILKGSGERGREITVTYSERLNKDGTLDTENINAFNRGKLRHCDKYIMSGEKTEVYHPFFVYHGFRYVHVENAPWTFELSAATVHTDLKRTASFECSDETLSWIHSASVKSTLTNFHSIPTDCPHREQNGWTADAHLSAHQALMNFDMTNVYRKWLGDFRDAQCENGQLPSVVPTPGTGYRNYNGIAWEGAAIIIPYNIYMIKGDLSPAAENYDVMEKFMDFLHTMAEDCIISYGLGDWCFPKNTKMCSTVLTNTAYYYRLACIMAIFSERLGKNSDKYRRLADNIGRSYHRHFVETGADCCQTALAAGLDFGLYGDAEKPGKVQLLVHLIEEADYHFECGILGTKSLFSALSENGRDDIIYKAVTNKTYPSYAFWKASGIDTLPEDWEMGSSLNHHMFSTADYWLLRSVAGIRLDRGSVSLKPCLLLGVDFKAAYLDYSIEKNGNTVTVCVPRETEITLGGVHRVAPCGKSVYNVKEDSANG